MRAGDLAPDDADLAAADLLLATVDESNTLAEVEAAKRNATLVHRLGEFLVSVRGVSTYLAPLTSSTPSILIRLVPGWVM